MGGGAGGFFAVKEAFKQAVSGGSRTPPDHTSALALVYGTSAMLCMAGWPGAVIGIAIFGLVLYAPVHGSTIMMRRSRRLALQLSLVAVMVLSVALVCGIATAIALAVFGSDKQALEVFVVDVIALDWLDDLDIPWILGIIGVILGLPLAYLLWRVTKTLLWERFGLHEMD